jgi:hypothetical protein
MAAVAALLIGAAPHAPGAAAAIAARLGGAPAAEATPPAARELALAVAALRGEPAAPTVEDAVVLLGDVLGPADAGRVLDQLAAATLGPTQVGGDPFFPDTARPGRSTGHVVTAAEEATSRALVARARRTSSVQQAVMSLLAGASAAAFPEIALATTLVGEDHDGALPPGTRAGDVLLCVPVDAAQGASLVLAVRRDGRLLQRKVVHRARCPG